MTSVLGIAAKHTGERGDRERSAELMTIAHERWVAETDLDGLSFLYDITIRRLYRLKHKGKPFDHLVKDLNLILELRDAIIENDVIGEMDGGDSEVISPGRIHRLVTHREEQHECRKPGGRRQSPGDRNQTRMRIPRTASHSNTLL